MRVQTVFLCEVCGTRIEYDYDIKAYLKHDHSALEKEGV